MRLTVAQRRVLEHLRDAEGAATKAADNYEYPEYEIVAEGIECFIGTKRTNFRLVKALLKIMAISDVSDGGYGAIFRRFQINETGRAYLADESQIDVVMRCLARGQNITFKDGRVVEI